MNASITSVLSICAGASLGALLRWLLAGRFNPLFPALPMGTLAANLLGGYLVGVAVAVFATLPQVPPQYRLFVITGFLGGLTTFSTFSAEVTTLLVRREWMWSMLTIGLHVVGSVALTVLGILIARMVFAWGQP